MHVDHAAVARANMRARTRDEPPHRLTAAEKDAQRERQAALNVITGYGCLTCCKLQPFGNQDGSTISCPLLQEPYRSRLDPVEATAAKTCQIPALYAEVMAGGRTQVTEAEVLELVPFALPDGLLEAHAADAAEPDPDDPEEPDPEWQELFGGGATSGAAGVTGTADAQVDPDGD